MAQHTFSSLCHGIQTLSTAGPVGPPHRLLLVGLLLASPREGVHQTPPGYSLLLCLGRVHCWHLQPFQERAEPRWRALSMQDQEHEAAQCLRHCQVYKGVWEGQHYHEELWGPPEPDVPYRQLSLRGVRWCQTSQSCRGWTQTWESYTNPWWGHEEVGVHGIHPPVRCPHWWVSHTLLLWAHDPTEDVHHGRAMSCLHCHRHDHFSWSCNLQAACWLRVWGEQYYWNRGPLQSDRRKYGHRDGMADPHPYDHQWQREGLAQRSCQGGGLCHEWSCEAGPRMASGRGTGHHRRCLTPRGWVVQL